MIKTKTKISKQSKRKTNSELVETIREAKKHQEWMEIASYLSSPRKNHSNLNLSEISKNGKDNEIIVIPGKVLSMGELDKKIKIVALSASVFAKEKILKSGNKFITILEEIKQNPSAKGVKILR